MDAQNCLNRRQLKDFEFIVEYSYHDHFYQDGTVTNTGKSKFDSKNGLGLHQFTERELNCSNQLRSKITTVDQFVLRVPSAAGKIADNQTLIPLLPNFSAINNGYKYKNYVEIINNQLVFTHYKNFDFIAFFNALVPDVYFSNLPEDQFPWFVCLKTENEITSIDLILPENYNASNGVVFARLDSKSSVVNFIETGLGSGAIFYPGAPNDPDFADDKIPRLFSTIENFTAQGWKTFHCALNEISSNTCNFFSKINDEEYISDGVWNYPDFDNAYSGIGSRQSYVGFLNVPTGPNSSVNTQSLEPVINYARADKTGCCRNTRPLQVALITFPGEEQFPIGFSYVTVDFYDLNLGTNTATFPVDWPWPDDFCRIKITPTYESV